MEHIVQNAIKAERLVETRIALRSEDENNFRIMPQTRELRKNTYISQICNSGDSADERRNRLTGINHIQVVCQMCNRDGHSASQCKN